MRYLLLPHSVLPKWRVLEKERYFSVLDNKYFDAGFLYRE